MKLIIPQLDQYILKCKSSNMEPVYENFIFENNELEIDRASFETYYEYKHGSSVLSILEFQNIQSYSEFISEEGGEESQESENNEFIESESNIDEITEAEGDNSIIIDFMFRRPRIIKAYKKILELQKKNIDAIDVNRQFNSINDKIEDLENKIKSGRISDTEKQKLVDQLILLNTQKSKGVDSVQKKSSAIRERISKAIEDLEYNISKLATSEYLKRVADKENVKTSIAMAEYRLKGADEDSKNSIEAEIKSNEKALLNIEAELKKTNALEKESGEIAEINDEIEITYSSKTMSDDEKLNKVQELELQRLDKTLSLGKQFEDAVKDPSKLKEKLNELLADIKIDKRISTYKGFEEMVANKRSEIEAGTSADKDGTDSSAQESINVYESIATRFSRLINK
jgi:hypothetical protein